MTQAPVRDSLSTGGGADESSAYIVVELVHVSDLEEGVSTL